MLDLNEILTVGQNFMIRKVVQRSDTAAAYSKDLNQFLSTPTIIDLAIRASMETIDKYLPDDYVSIGFSIKFAHTAATSLGMTLTAMKLTSASKPGTNREKSATACTNAVL